MLVIFSLMNGPKCLLKIKRTLIVPLFFGLFGCEDTQNASGGSNLEYETILIKRDSLSIVLDDKTSYEFLNVSYFENDTLEVLLSVNYLINGFNLYDLSSAKLLSQVSIPNDGPFSVRELQGVTIRNLDSIYVFSKVDLRNVSIVDYKSNFKDTFYPHPFEPRNNFSRPVPILNHQSNTSTPTMLSHNKLIFSKYEVFDYYMSSNINSDYSGEFYLDLKSLEFSELPITFPRWLQNKSMHLFSMLHTKTLNEDGQLVYAFYGEDSLRVYDMSNNHFDVYLAKYDKDNKERVFYKGRPNSIQSLEDGLGNYLYTQIIYDKYRKVYYRILERPIKYNPAIHKNSSAYYQKPVSCVILDSDFKKIGEVDFAEDVYRSYGSFVGKNGLYVPRLSTNYKNLDEDRVEYSVYVLDSNKNIIK